MAKPFFLASSSALASLPSIHLSFKPFLINFTSLAQATLSQEWGMAGVPELSQPYSPQLPEPTDHLQVLFQALQSTLACLCGTQPRMFVPSSMTHFPSWKTTLIHLKRGMQSWTMGCFLTYQSTRVLDGFTSALRSAQKASKAEDEAVGLQGVS